ncbi:hypothetical protein [Nocardioides alcanivorans]|nr:hypothetical protein [Nocardioides alcanivorans]
MNLDVLPRIHLVSDPTTLDRASTSDPPRSVQELADRAAAG